MTVSTGDTEPALAALPAAGGRVRAVLWGGAVLAVVAAGLVLWSARADAVFVDMLSAAVAWCF